MVSSQQHIIRKVMVDVVAKSEGAAFRLKDTIDVFLKEEIFPSLECYFESLEEELQSQTIQISQLTLEVNGTSDNDFKDLKETIKKQVVQEFQKAIKNPNIENENVVFLSSAQSKEQALIYFLEKGIPPWWNGAENNDFLNEKTIVELSHSTSFIQSIRKKLQFVHIQDRLINQFSDTQIQHVLYNAFKKDEVKTSILENDIIEKFKEQTPRFRQFLWKKYINYFLKKEPSVFITELMQFIPSNKKEETQKRKSKSLIEMVQLIAFQFDDFLPNEISFEGVKAHDLFHVKGLEKTIAIHEDEINAEEIDEVIGIETDNRDAKQSPRTISIKQQRNRNSENSDVFEKAENESKKERASQSKIATKTSKGVAAKSIRVIDVTIEAVIGKYQPQKVETQDYELTKQNKFLEGNETTQKEEVVFNTDLQTEKKQELNKEFTENTMSETPIQPEEKGEYYIDNAGLIILHPYLKDFFVNCNLLNDENEMEDPELAIHLLHYIATKKENQFESNMVFEKFLCGVSIHTSIRREVVISKELKQKSEALLKAIISNWSALNNASTDLLRNEFLQRSGKINFKDVNPRVVVERKVQDILLDRIPWTLSICKLPWVHKLIFTDW